MFVLVLSAFLFRVLEIDNLNNITKSFLLLCVSLNSYYLKFILLSRLNILFNSSYLYFKEKLNNINNLINKIDIIINWCLYVFLQLLLISLCLFLIIKNDIIIYYYDNNLGEVNFIYSLIGSWILFRCWIELYDYKKFHILNLSKARFIFLSLSLGIPLIFIPILLLLKYKFNINIISIIHCSSGSNSQNHFLNCGVVDYRSSSLRRL